MFGDFFYNQSIRKTVAVFGTLFNDLSVVRKDSSGKVLNIAKVPLAYGPKQKFLSRIDQAESYEGQSIAIKLPRMSFEITSFSYDAATKLNKNTIQKYPTKGREKSTGDYSVGPVIYNMGIQLSIYTKTQDDVLQILEQIIPYFQPQYTVTVKELDGNISSDYPFILNGVSFEDTYEGNYETRRAIIYTLDFVTKVRFYGDIRHHPLIKKVNNNYFVDGDPTPFESDAFIVQPWEAEESDPHTIKHIRTNYLNMQHIADVELDSVYNINVGDAIITQDNATVGRIQSINGNTIEVYGVDGEISVGECIILMNKPGLTYTVVSVNTRWQ